MKKKYKRRIFKRTNYNGENVSGDFAQAAGLLRKSNSNET